MWLRGSHPHAKREDNDLKQIYFCLSSWSSLVETYKEVSSNFKDHQILHKIDGEVLEK